jgi:outer membrane immunogenic protein
VGGYAGYNWKIAPTWLVGIEGDIAWGNSSKTHTPFPGSSVFFGIVPGNDFVTVKLDWDASIRGRVGYLLTPTWLLYATGGAAWQEIKTSASCSGVGGNSSYCVGAFSDSTSTTKSGWTVGGGVEAAFAPHWLARIEYRYADFGDVSNTFPKAPNFGFHANISVKTNTALAGVAYKF